MERLSEEARLEGQEVLRRIAQVQAAGPLAAAAAEPLPGASVSWEQVGEGSWVDAHLLWKLICSSFLVRAVLWSHHAGSKWAHPHAEGMTPRALLSSLALLPQVLHYTDAQAAQQAAAASTPQQRRQPPAATAAAAAAGAKGPDEASPDSVAELGGQASAATATEASVGQSHVDASVSSPFREGPAGPAGAGAAAGRAAGAAGATPRGLPTFFGLGSVSLQPELPSMEECLQRTNQAAAKWGSRPWALVDGGESSPGAWASWHASTWAVTTCDGHHSPACHDIVWQGCIAPAELSCCAVRSPALHLAAHSPLQAC